ncbi:polysaccharide biosynthesis C-terminal domain-containing protein [Acrocarpospora sp. B8E8]|uniref:lipopolysaccharide biosynthesis protein n=1 Tax=Acrocarpospora sp. B8E8 TaxID=3153572 RepID=UPI00325E0C87
MSRRPDATRRAVDTLASQLLRLGIGAVTGVLLARALAPESRGLYAVVATTAAITMEIGHLSLQHSQIALWPDMDKRRALLANSVFLSLALGLLCAVGGYTAGLVLPLAPSGLLAIALLAVPFGVATVNLKGMLLLQSRQRLVNRTLVLAALIQCVPLLILMALGKESVAAVIVCLALSMTVPCALFLVVSKPLKLRGEVALARHQIGLAARYHLGHIAFYLLVTVDVLLLNALASARDAGFYTVAVSVLSLAGAPAEAIRQLSLARQADGDCDSARQATTRALRLALLTAAAVVTALTAAGPLLIPLVYGPAYAPSVAPLLALAPGAILLALLKPVEQFLVRLSQPMTMTAIAIIGLGVNLVLNGVLIPHWGAVGAALSSTVAYGLIAVIEVTWFVRASRTAPRELVPRRADLVTARSG